MTPNEANEILVFANSKWPKGAKFKFFARRNGEPVIGCSVWSPEDLSQLTEWTDKHGYSAYWQINPTRRSAGKRSRTADISHWTFLPLDIDPVSPTYYSLGCLYDIEDRLSVILGESFIPENRTLIDSGRGIQALYSFPARELDDALRVQVPQSMSRLFSHVAQQVGDCTGCVLDTSCSDLPRVMRLPYTINPKTGLRADFIQVSREHALPSPDVILETYPPPEPKQIVKCEGTHWVEFLPMATVAARRFIEGGTGSGSRHKAATATMLSLMELGCGPGQILSALRMGAVLCNPVLPTREVEDMVFRRFRLQTRTVA
jgi:hypothetical protein